MKLRSAIIGFGLLLASAQAHAASDALIEGAKLCTNHLPRYEREYGIPTHLLSAIASTESGRYHEGLKIRVPWPWTINAEGKGYIFDTKAQAIAAVKRLKAHGVQSIDVGCMQVNIYHHPDAFTSLEQAFEPETNIAYAAGFLRSLYDEDGSWKQAAGDYHSKTPNLGKKYVSEVYNSWSQIINKLRAAQLQVPESSVVAMNELKAPLRAAKAKMQSVAEKTAVKLAAYHSTHENSIHVSRQEMAQNTVQNDVIVVKPEIKVADNAPIAQAQLTQVSYTTAAPQIKVAPAMQVPLTAQQQAPGVGSAGVGSAMQALSEGEMQNATVTTPRRNGPNFIFND